MARKTIVEEACSIHMAANVSRRVFAERVFGASALNARCELLVPF
jgi:hypothetical protein